MKGTKVSIEKFSKFLSLTLKFYLHSFTLNGSSPLASTSWKGRFSKILRPDILTLTIIVTSLNLICTFYNYNVPNLLSEKE